MISWSQITSTSFIRSSIISLTSIWTNSPARLIETLPCVINFRVNEFDERSLGELIVDEIIGNERISEAKYDHFLSPVHHLDPDYFSGTVPVQNVHFPHGTLYQYRDLCQHS